MQENMGLAKPNESQKSSSREISRNRKFQGSLEQMSGVQLKWCKRKYILKLEQKLNGNQMTEEKKSQRMTHKNIP